jgi:hypothetical protein
LEFLRAFAFARKRAVIFIFGLLSFSSVKLFFRPRFPLATFSAIRAYSSDFMTPLIALAEHVFFRISALTQGVSALHRMI